MLIIEKTPNEKDLLSGCRKNKPAAQKALYEKVGPKMLAVCSRYIHDREEAEHLMIGGMVKVFEKISSFKSEGSLEGWIRRIMVNEWLMYLRKNRNMSIEVDLQVAEYEPDYQKLENLLESQDLMNLIQELPVGYRTVFNLYAIEGYNHAEIGEMLGISENTSKSQLSRARKILQNKLTEIEQRDLKNNQHVNS